MIFTVVWKPSAEEKLAEIWANASDRAAVTQAADSVDAQLRRAPLEVGESRDNNSRILSEAPLSVYYDVSDKDRLVSVWAVWTV